MNLKVHYSSLINIALQGVQLGDALDLNTQVGWICMHQEGQKTNLTHTPTTIRRLGQRWGWGQRLALLSGEAGTRGAQHLADRPTVHETLVLAWTYLYTHKKRALNYIELGRNTVKAGGHTGLTAVLPSKHFDVVFLQERAISEIIYLTDIKLVHYSGPEFLLNHISLQHLLCQRCFLFQIIWKTAVLGVHSLLVWHF